MERQDSLQAIVRFVAEAEGLKSVIRSAHTVAGRPESTAEHSWRLALLAAAIAGQFPEVNLERVLLMCLLHDLGELYGGDVPAVRQSRDPDRHRREEADAKRLFSLLEGPRGALFLQLYREYEAGETPEARLVKALDKAETILQHSQGENPPDFDYAFNLSYGREYFRDDPRLTALRGLLDAATGARLTERSVK